MNTEKMKKAAKNMDIEVKIVGGIFGAFVWVLAVMGLLVLILGEQMFNLGSVSLDLEYISLYLAAGTPVEIPVLRICIAAGLFVAAIVCFLVGRGAKLVRKILATMQEGRPFEADAPAYLRKIAWMTLAGGAMVQIVKILNHLMMIRALPMEAIFSSPVIEKVEYSIIFDFGFVWIACIILFLSYVFDYGQKLQTESDETL